MTDHLNRKVDAMEYDRLIAGMTPSVKVTHGTIAKLATATEYPRGTIFAKSAKTGKLCILGATADSDDTLTPDCILCDREEIGISADENVAVYVAGCFNINAITVADGYTITQTDKDKLRERGLYFSQLFD